MIIYLKSFDKFRRIESETRASSTYGTLRKGNIEKRKHQIKDRSLHQGCGFWVEFAPASVEFHGFQSLNPDFVLGA